MRKMTTEDAMKVIERAVSSAGTQSAFAKLNGLSAAYVNDVVKGRKLPSKAILDAVGLERVTLYRRKADPASAA